MSKPYRLYHGNCLHILKEIPDESVDMIFADPPYNLSNNGMTCKGGKMVSVNKGEWDKSQGIEADYAFHYEWLKECQRVLKQNGTLWVSGTYHSIYACGHAMQKLGYHVLNDICWFKPNASPNLSCRFFTASHETLIWARKDKKSKHIFDYKEMKLGEYPEDRIKVPEKQMRSVWSIPVTPQSEKTYGKHPTQKPLALLDRIVKSSTKCGDIILDPFCGSGTTGVSAIKNSRRFVGVEKEKEFIDLTYARLKSLKDFAVHRPTIYEVKEVLHGFPTGI